MEFYIVHNMKPKRFNNINHLLALRFNRSHNLINHMMWRLHVLNVWQVMPKCQMIWPTVLTLTINKRVIDWSGGLFIFLFFIFFFNVSFSLFLENCLLDFEMGKVKVFFYFLCFIFVIFRLEILLIFLFFIFYALFLLFFVLEILLIFLFFIL